MKLGLIGEEMIATAVKLAQERGSDVEALHVVRMPLSKSLDAPLDPDRGGAGRSSRSRRRACSARTTASSYAADTVRARSIGEAIVHEAIARTST